MTVLVENFVEQTLFDINESENTESWQLALAEEAASTVLALGKCAMQFARVERVPRYDEYSRENDAEHSFMLALVATEIAKQYYPELDSGLVTQYCIVHDLIELETSDVATFTLDDADLAAKEMAERDAFDRLATKLPVHTRELFLRYEAQVEPEARFVRLVDKKLPLVVDIYGAGRKVMQEDYGITTETELTTNEQRFSDRLRARFPEKNLLFLHLVRKDLAARFSAIFE